MSNSCKVCKSETSALHLCARHIKYLNEALDEIPWLHSQLQTTITRTDKLQMGVTGRKSSESPSPINWGGSRLGDEVMDLLIFWMTKLIEDNGLTFLPKHAVPHDFIGPLVFGFRRLPRRGYSGSIDQRVVWLKHHINAIAGREDAGDFYFDIIGLTSDPDKPQHPPGRLVAAINTRSRRWAGPCPEIKGYSHTGETIRCSEILYARDGAEVAECDECRKAEPPRSFTVDVQANLIRAFKEQDLMPEKRLYEAMAAIGEPIYSDLVQRWIKSGQLVPVGYLSGSKIVEKPVSSKDPRLFSMARVRMLRWQHQNRAAS